MFILTIIFILVGCLVYLYRYLAYSRPLRDTKHWNIVDYFYFIFKLIRPILKAQKGKDIKGFFYNQDMSFDIPDGFKTISKTIICAGGDIMQSVGYSKESLAHVWDDIWAFLFESDIVFANLETPLDPLKLPSILPKGDRIKDWIGKGTPRLNGTLTCLEPFFQKGAHLDILSTASNHCLDMGPESLKRTLDLLDTRGINHVGTSRSRDEQEDIPIIEKNNIRFAFLAYTFSLNHGHLPSEEEYLANFLLLNEPKTDISLIRHHISIARSRGADIIIASLHWGQDIEVYPIRNIIDRGHEIIEAGVDIILGHHPHILQPMEKYSFCDPLSGQTRVGFIAYSLSELLLYLHFLPVSWLSCVLRIEVSKGIMDGRDITLINDVKMLPFYKLCRQSHDGKYEYRNIDLRKTLSNLLYYKEVLNLSTNEIIAMVKANDFLERYIYPENKMKILLPI